MAPQLTEDELLNPTKYRTDSGTMTMHPDRERSVHYMQITFAGAPPVFLRKGRFHDQSGADYDTARFPGGEDGLRKHIEETCTRETLESFGYVFSERSEGATAQVEKPEQAMEPTKEELRNQQLMRNLKGIDTSGDQQAVLEALGDREMDIDSISKVARIKVERVRKAINDLGGNIDRIGEGRRGSPYLYRRFVAQ